MQKETYAKNYHLNLGREALTEGMQMLSVILDTLQSKKKIYW